VAGEATIAMEGSLVRWDNWEFHLRVDQRVGPVLSLLQYRDGDALRDVAYQLAVSEMFVPYMDPAPTWSWRAYMDVGEYGFGLLASTLQPGADCPASAQYLDHTLAGEDGQPFTLRNVVCIFERPSGDPLWRHVGDVSNESRPKTELVVRMAPVVGNYDYLIDYVFDQAGDIEVRVGAAGIDAVKGVAAQSLADPTARADTAYGTLVAPGLVAPNHEHHMIFRIDMDVDGGANRAVFDLIDPQRLPRSNPRRSLWTVASHVLPEAGPLAHAGHEGHLRIESTARRNAMGYSTSYQLYPGHSAASVLDANDPVQRRALWSAQPVWLSRFAPDQLYASGPYPNANPASIGLREWTAGRQDIEDEDLVLWYDIGFRHVPRAEDWPSMPAVWHSFRLRPFNFFDRNPALDVAPAAQRVP
jgi:primary-amine oxidase